MAARHAGHSSFRLGRFDGHEEIKIPARRFNGQLLGLAALALAWPLIAIAKYGLIAVFSSGLDGLLFLLSVTLIVLLPFALLQIAWWLVGSERIAVIGRDLLVRHTILGLPVMTRSYRGADMRFLAPASVLPPQWLTEPSVPFLGSTSRGTLKFFYHGQTVYLGHDLAVADTSEVVAWLAARLPPGAADR